MMVFRMILLLLGIFKIEEIQGAPRFSNSMTSECADSNLKWRIAGEPEVNDTNVLKNSPRLAPMDFTTGIPRASRTVQKFIGSSTRFGETDEKLSRTSKFVRSRVFATSGTTRAPGERKTTSPSRKQKNSSVPRRKATIKNIGRNNENKSSLKKRPKTSMVDKTGSDVKAEERTKKSSRNETFRYSTDKRRMKNVESKGNLMKYLPARRTGSPLLQSNRKLANRPLNGTEEKSTRCFGKTRLTESQTTKKSAIPLDSRTQRDTGSSAERSKRSTKAKRDNCREAKVSFCIDKSLDCHVIKVNNCCGDGSDGILSISISGVAMNTSWDSQRVEHTDRSSSPPNGPSIIELLDSPMFGELLEFSPKDSDGRVVEAEVPSVTNLQESEELLNENEDLGDQEDYKCRGVLESDSTLVGHSSTEKTLWLANPDEFPATKIPLGNLATNSGSYVAEIPVQRPQPEVPSAESSRMEISPDEDGWDNLEAEDQDKEEYDEKYEAGTNTADVSSMTIPENKLLRIDVMASVSKLPVAANNGKVANHSDDYVDNDNYEKKHYNDKMDDDTDESDEW